jgi:NADH:ubiquinone oxidoreductase subunit
VHSLVFDGRGGNSCAWTQSTSVVLIMSGSMKPYKWFSGTSGWIHELLAKLPKDMQTKVRERGTFASL